MSTKDFKKGMVAGAKPFGDKLDQLANVSEKAVTDIAEGIGGVSDVVNCILDDLSIQEKKSIYDLDTPSGIAELDQSEKEYLLAVLFTIADKKGAINDNQRFYLRALKTYLRIVNVQAGIDLSTIENIDSIPFQKTIMQTVMEFLYLEYKNHDYMDDYGDYFDLFSVNRKGVRELQNTIDHMVSLLGIEGLACHYSPLPEPQFIEESVEADMSADCPSVDEKSHNTAEEQADVKHPCKRIECDIYVHTRAEGGRNTPFFSHYLPQFRFNNDETTGEIILPEDVDMCMPGSNVCAIVELKSVLTLGCGDAFSMIERQKNDLKIVGTGTIRRIIE